MRDADRGLRMCRRRIGACGNPRCWSFWVRRRMRLDRGWAGKPDRGGSRTTGPSAPLDTPELAELLIEARRHVPFGRPRPDRGRRRVMNPGGWSDQTGAANLIDNGVWANDPVLALPLYYPSSRQLHAAVVGARQTSRGVGTRASPLTIERVPAGSATNPGPSSPLALGRSWRRTCGNVTMETGGRKAGVMRSPATRQGRRLDLCASIPHARVASAWHRVGGWQASGPPLRRSATCPRPGSWPEVRWNRPAARLDGAANVAELSGVRRRQLAALAAENRADAVQVKARVAGGGAGERTRR